MQPENMSALCVWVGRWYPIHLPSTNDFHLRDMPGWCRGVYTLHSTHHQVRIWISLNYSWFAELDCKSHETRPLCETFCPTEASDIVTTASHHASIPHGRETTKLRCNDTEKILGLPDTDRPCDSLSVSSQHNLCCLHSWSPVGLAWPGHSWKGQLTATVAFALLGLAKNGKLSSMKVAHQIYHSDLYNWGTVGPFLLQSLPARLILSWESVSLSPAICL